MKEKEFVKKNILLKQCTKCKIEKPATKEFFHSGRLVKSTGLFLKETCKECRKGEHTNYYENRKIQISSSDILTAKNIFKIYKKIDNKNGFEFSLTESWILKNIVNGSCIYCGFNEKMGIDRIFNNKGHSIDNCVPCCKICNITRMDNFSHEEFKLIGKTIRLIKLNRNGN